MKLPDPKCGFEHALRTLPTPGGNGYHPALLGTANRGIMAGVTPAELFRLLRAHTPQGSRVVSNREISDAVSKAANDLASFPSQRRNSHHCARPDAGLRPFSAAKMLRGILGRGQGATEADLWESSPVRIDWEPGLDAVELLRRLYAPDDFLFIGTRYCAGPDSVRAAGTWAAHFESGAYVPEHVVPNPMTGEEGLTKKDTQSFRADSCVAKFRYAVIEFDTTPEPLRDTNAAPGPWPREDQVRFWAGALAFGWPVAVLIDSGGKSIHGWLAVFVSNADEWTDNVENELFAHWLVPCGVDRSCRNESRLSRMPGHRRANTARWQRLLYLNPEICEVTT